MVWAKGLAGARILNLLHLPHFSHYNITSLVVCQLMELVHDGCLWLQDRIPIDVALIHRITGLPMHGPSPRDGTSKKFQHHLAKTVWAEYRVRRNKRGFLIDTITDPSTCLGTQILSCKLMRKFQASTTPAHVI